MMITSLLRPPYSLPFLYVLTAVFVILSEWNDTGFLARLGTVLVAVPWTVWIPDYIDFNYPDMYVYDTDIRILFVGVLANATLFWGLGRGIEKIYKVIKSRLTK
jgi:hypothetical protein